MQTHAYISSCSRYLSCQSDRLLSTLNIAALRQTCQLVRDARSAFVMDATE